jgi:Cu+-exporting ATPase
MTTNLSIKGMSCANCQKHVAEALKALPGVTSAEADFKTGTAKVVHNEAIDKKTFTVTVDEAGYTLLKVNPGA